MKQDRVLMGTNLLSIPYKVSRHRGQLGFRSNQGPWLSHCLKKNTWLMWLSQEIKEGGVDVFFGWLFVGMWTDLRFFGGQANTLGMEEWTLGAMLFVNFSWVPLDMPTFRTSLLIFCSLGVCFSRPGSYLNLKQGIILEHKEEDQD